MDPDIIERWKASA